MLKIATQSLNVKSALLVCMPAFSGVTSAAESAGTQTFGDYWIEPSIVWGTEFDIELPHAGGTLFSFNSYSTPTASPVGATSNDDAIITQFAIGF